jgi:dihydrofolate reductase
MGKYGVIGRNGSIPWMGKMPDDLAYFKEKTMGKTVVVGRKTWETLPTLKGRNFIVMSREPSTAFFSFDQVLEMIKDEDETFIIGGADIYREFLPYADTMYITYIVGAFMGDTFFPPITPSEWEKIDSKYVEANHNNLYTAEYLTYKRKSHL